MASIPVEVNTYFTPFYYFMQKNGFEIVAADYDRTNEDNACTIVFKEGTDFKKLVNFMNLPKRDINISNMVLSKDNSYCITLLNNAEICMTIDKKHHTSIICYIMANGKV